MHTTTVMKITTQSYAGYRIQERVYRTLNMGSTMPWKTLLERPRPDRGFKITSILGGVLHLKSNSGGVSV